MSIFFKLIQLENIFVIEVTWLVSNFDKSIVSKDLQLLKASLI